MKYYTIDPIGKVHCGKANSWKDVSIAPYEKLYNPYTGRTVYGWGNYCMQMAKGQKEFYAKKKRGK